MSHTTKHATPPRASRAVAEAFGLTALFFVAGCDATATEVSEVDGGGVDADATTSSWDAMLPDSDLLDAGVVDSAVPDSTVPDSGPLDRCVGFDGLSGPALRGTLQAQVGGHRVLSYRDARDAMYGISGDIDVVGGQVESLYTGQTVPPDGTRTPGGVFNTEHVWPRSMGAEQEPALSDLHHIFPCDVISNAERDSFPFGVSDCGEVGACFYSEGGSELGLDANGDIVFEVRPERRGDVARAKFYFAVRYRRSVDRFEEAVLRSWHEQDPPDAREQVRNDEIESLQRNRNPFVDCPALVDRVDNF